MTKLFRKFKAKFMHWHRWSPTKAPASYVGWIVSCKCGKAILTRLEDEKMAKELAWKSNVHSGNVKANYINNGVLKDEPLEGIKLP